MKFIRFNLQIMKKNEMKKNIILSLLIIFSACSKKLDDNKSIMSTMMQWKQAVLSENPREISKFYSNDFFSEEIGGKEQVAEFWKIVINAGMIDGIEINLNTSKVDLNGDVAEFLIFDDEGEVEMGFILTKENKAWLISGTLSESNENYEDDYLAEYGDECIQIDGLYRCWDVHVPDKLDDKYPLVLDLHGWGDTVEDQKNISGFQSLADTFGFVLVWPYGLARSWNSGEECCPPASDDDIDDVDFLRKLIEKVSNQYNIDTKRIYFTGLSNGCAMAQRMAVEASDIVSSVACIALHLLVPESQNYSPVSVMTLFGTKDDLYYPSDLPGALENLNTWKEINNCEGDPKETWRSNDHFTLTYENCDNQTEVSLVTINEGGHVLYQGVQTDVNTSRMAWDFISRFKK